MQRRAALLSSAALAASPVVSSPVAVSPLRLLRPEVLSQELVPEALPGVAALPWREPEEEDSLSIGSPGTPQSAKAARWLSMGHRLHGLLKDLSDDMEAQARSTRGWHTLGERMAFLFEAEAEDNEREWNDDGPVSKVSAWRSLASRMQGVFGTEGEGSQGMLADELAWDAPRTRLDQVLAAVEAHDTLCRQQLSSLVS